jgi:crossover junction endodeoxyribonuclease RuvC
LRILGVDPGLSTTGYGIIEVTPNGLTCLNYGCIHPSSKMSFSEKLLKIYQNIEQVILKFQPDYCAVENIYYHQNKKTAIIMGHVRAVALLAAARMEVPVFEFSPREVKLAIVGFGGASKPQVQAMVQKILAMQIKPSPEDAADALAIAVCLYHRLKFQNMVQNLKT